MTFTVYRCIEDPDFFVVTDDAHQKEISGAACPSGGDLKQVGKFDEMGKDRAAFNEMIAKDAIKTQGYYRFEAKTWDPVAQAPGTMPG